MGNKNSSKKKTSPVGTSSTSAKVQTKDKQATNPLPSSAPMEEKKVVNSRKKIPEFFDRYAKGEDIMGPEAVMSFCDDLDIDPEHISVLILSWYFSAEIMCYFSREEFIRGCTKLECENISQLKEKMVAFPELLKDEQKFKEIYEFAFFWSRENPDKKVLDIETSSDMLELLLDDASYPFSGPFRKFLHEQKSYKCMNKDQWLSLLEFCKTIDEDFSNYDENGSWPVMLDEFVLWTEEQPKSSHQSNAAPGEHPGNTIC